MRGSVVIRGGAQVAALFSVSAVRMYWAGCVGPRAAIDFFVNGSSTVTREIYGEYGFFSGCTCPAHRRGMLVRRQCARKAMPPR